MDQKYWNKKYMIFENITLLKPRKYLTIMATN